MNQKFVTLNDGNKMPQLGLGVWQATNKETEHAVTTALEAGYRSIDTATVYENEQGVGKALIDSNIKREELFITTKLWNPDQNNVRDALCKSLEHLQLDYVDSYLIHWPCPAKKLYLKAWEALIQAQQDGLIKSIGVSNFLPEHIEHLIKETGVKPVLNQIELHPLFNQAEMKVWCKQNNIYVQAWSPLAQGGKGVFDHPDVVNLANKYNKTAAQIIIRWHLQENTIVIPKSITPSRIRENFTVFDFELTKNELKAINAINKNERLGPHPIEFQ